MAKLPNQEICVQDIRSRQRSRVVVECKVLSDGYFMLKLNQPHEDIAKSLFKGNRIEKGDCIVAYDRKNHLPWISNQTLEGAVNGYKSILRESLESDISYSPVILYNWTSKYCASIDGDGNIHINGTYGNECRHVGNLHATQTERTYMIGLAAAVRIKKTITTKETEIVEYLFPSHAELDGWNGEIGPEAERLNGFCGISFTTNFDNRSISDAEIPYTEAAAMWFVNQMHSLQKLAYGMEQFFGKQSNVVSAIERGAIALLTGSNRSPDQ